MKEKNKRKQIREKAFKYSVDNEDFSEKTEISSNQTNAVSRLWCLIVTLSLSHCILGQVWYLIVSIPVLCPLSYFQHLIMLKR